MIIVYKKICGSINLSSPIELLPFIVNVFQIQKNILKIIGLNFVEHCQ